MPEPITTATGIIIGGKLLGKTADKISEDIAKLYEKGRDKIIEKAINKTNSLEDGKQTNLRVTRDVFWNGSFTDEEICAEYFGGILASSRSSNGEDDSGVYYVDLIKSLSSKQLLLHYIIYSSLNKVLVHNLKKSNLNPGQENELQKENLFLSTNEILKIIENDDFGRDIHILCAKGLISRSQTDDYQLKNGKKVPNLKVIPTTVGVQLYAVAHNKLSDWYNFSTINFGEFSGIKSVKYYGGNIKELLERGKIKDE